MSMITMRTQCKYDHDEYGDKNGDRDYDDVDDVDDVEDVDEVDEIDYDEEIDNDENTDYDVDHNIYDENTEYDENVKNYPINIQKLFNNFNAKKNNIFVDNDIDVNFKYKLEPTQSNNTHKLNSADKETIKKNIISYIRRHRY